MTGLAKLNAIRSGIVVVGFLAFGYLSLELGFKPYLLKAQELKEEQEALRKPQHHNDNVEEFYSTVIFSFSFLLLITTVVIDSSATSAYVID